MRARLRSNTMKVGEKDCWEEWDGRGVKMPRRARSPSTNAEGAREDQQEVGTAGRTSEKHNKGQPVKKRAKEDEKQGGTNNERKESKTCNEDSHAEGVTPLCRPVRVAAQRGLLH